MKFLRTFLVAVLVLGPRGIQGENCFSIPDQKVVPGQQDVWFPVLLTSEDPIQGFQVRAVFDPAVLTFGGVELEHSVLAKRAPEFFQADPNPGSSVEIAGILDFLDPITGSVLAPARSARLLSLVFDVAADAAAGTRTQIDLVSDASFRNILIVGGFALEPCLQGSTVEVVGGNPGLFIRGDADLNGTIEMGDAVRVIGYLFLGQGAPPCLDAADFHDRGRLDIGSPVAILEFLFRGGSPPAVPFPNAGLDPTEDRLGC